MRLEKVELKRVMENSSRTSHGALPGSCTAHPATLTCRCLVYLRQHGVRNSEVDSYRVNSNEAIKQLCSTQPQTPRAESS